MLLLFRRKKSRRAPALWLSVRRGWENLLKIACAVKRRYPRSNEFPAFLETRYIGRYVELNKKKRSWYSTISLDLHILCQCCRCLIFFLFLCAQNCENSGVKNFRARHAKVRNPSRRDIKVATLRVGTYERWARLMAAIFHRSFERIIRIRIYSIKDFLWF